MKLCAIITQSRSFSYPFPCKDCGCLFVQCFEALPEHLKVEPVTCTRDVMRQRLEVEADEMASLVKKKANQQWIWLAMDVKTHPLES
jgi:hypothetical protein